MSGPAQPPPAIPPAGMRPSYGPRGPSDDQTWSLLAYLLAIIAAVIAPLVIYLVKRDESGYVRYHAAQALNLGLTGVIYGFGGLILGVLVAIATKGLALIVLVPLFIAYAVAHLVFLILAAVAANRGELYRVPTIICLPMVR